MKNKIGLMKWSLLGGGIYFMLICVVHLTGVKVPGLYIYFNIPSYDYQDKIIAFLTFGWGIFFVTAAGDTGNLKLLRSILIVGLGAISGLIFVNLSSDFEMLSPGINTGYFWIQNFILGLYLLWLFLLYRKISIG